MIRNIVKTLKFKNKNYIIMINEVLYACIAIKVYFIWHLTYIHTFTPILINAEQGLRT